MFVNKNNVYLNRFSQFFICTLPFLLLFYRGIADTTLILIVLVFLLKSFKEGNWSWVKEQWFIFAIIFWLYLILINAPLSINPEKSLFYAIAFIRWPIFAIALSYWIFNNQKNRKIFLVSFSIAFGFIIFDTWWQYLVGFDLFGYPWWSPKRLTGPFRDNPIPGIWISRLIFLFILLSLIHKPFNNNLKTTLLYIVILFTGLLTVFLTGERMAFIIIFGGSILILIGIFIEYQSTRLYLFLISMFGLILFLIFGSFNPETTQRTFFSAIEKIQHLSTSDYGIVFKSAYDVWLESPILGVGIHQYRQACIDLGLWGSGPGVCWHPHNISLELLSETGIIGFLLFYTMIISILIKIMKSFGQSKNWILLSLLLTFLLVCFFPFTSGISIFNNGFATIIWLMMGWLFVCIKMKVK